MNEEIAGLQEILHDFLKTLIHIGKVVELYPEENRAVVELTDLDYVKTYKLPVLQAKAFADKFYHMPDIGERVLCVFLPYGNEVGFILGSIYTDEIKPAEKSNDITSIIYKDGTVIRYDRVKHKLLISVKGDLDIEAKNINIRAEKINSGTRVLYSRANDTTFRGKFHVPDDADSDGDVYP